MVADSASNVKPYISCAGGHKHTNIVLCDHFNYCYYSECIKESDGTVLYDGFWLS